jgi:hypothetical protein
MHDVLRITGEPAMTPRPRHTLLQDRLLQLCNPADVDRMIVTDRPITAECGMQQHRNR